jgi:hypothetical protein
MAHVWSPPAEIATAPEDRPDTLTGVALLVVDPSPSWPMLLPPQHVTPPLVVMAHVWSPPAEIAMTPEDRPDTLTGVALLVVDPSPSWPMLLPPQHFTPPLVVMAHVWSSPAETAVTPAESPDTFTGVALLVVDPSPSWLK